MQDKYTASEIAPILGISERAVRKRAAKESWPLKKRAERLGGNHYYYVTLPSGVKASIAKHLADKIPKKVIDNTVIPDWSHKIGLARFQIVTGWRDFCDKQRKRGVKKTQATADFLGAYNGGQLLPGPFEVIGQVKQSTIYNWDKTLRENGDDYYSICDRRGQWNKGGKKGQGQLSAEAAEAFLSAWLTPNKPSVTMAYNVMDVILRKREAEIPSLATVYRYARRYQENNYNIVVLKREGEKALNDKAMPYIRRNSDLLEVGDCLFADGHTLNFECLHPETGQPFRPTLILWFDWKSGMPVGWEIMPTENTVAISSALYMAIVRLGVYPKVVYLDNGRAFKSKFFTDSTDFEELNGLYSRLGIGLQLAKPYHGQSKVVERFFGTFNEQFSRLMPSYTGRNIDDKPAWRARNEKYHQKRHEKRAGIPTLRQAMDAFEKYVYWYADRPHARITGKTHGEIFMAGQGPGVETAELDRHFLWSQKVRPQRAGFTLAKVRYESDSLFGLNKEIIIRFSWADLSVVHLFDLEGNNLGRAYPQEEVHPLADKLGDEHDKAMVADHNRRYAQLKKETMREARRLDGDLDQLPGFRSLSFVPSGQSAAEPKLPEAEPVFDLSVEERARLDAVYENAVRDMAAKPAVERPPYFQSEYDKYDWLFEFSQEGYQLTAEDMAFMAEYEASEEYLYHTGARYEELKKLGQSYDKGAMQ